MLRWPARSALHTGRARLLSSTAEDPGEPLDSVAAAANRSWTPYWRDRNLRSHLEDRLTPSRRVDELFNQVEHPAGIFWG